MAVDAILFLLAGRRFGNRLMGVVAGRALELTIRLDKTFTSQQPHRLETGELVGVLAKLFSREVLGQSVAISAELDFRFGIPIASAHRERRRRLGVSGLANVLAGRAVALFAVHVRCQIDDFLIDDFARGGVTIHAFVHHPAAVLIAE